MLRTGCSWLLLLLVLLLPACASYYRVEVGGDRPEQMRSLFLIVAEQDPLDANSQDVARLIRAEMIGKYLLFAQFDPAGGAPLRWHQQSLRGDSELIRINLNEDQSVVTLRVDKELLKSYGSLAVVAVGHGDGGWYSEVVDAGKIRNEEGLRLDIGASRFVRRQLQ